MPAIERLKKKVNEAAKVLAHLRTSVEHKKNKFKPGALKAAKGFLLLHTHKGAAVLGYEAGPGIAFKVLGHEADGTPILSPPVVMSMSKMGVGIQIGYNSIYTLMAVYHESQLDMLVNSHAGTIVGQDLDVSPIPFKSDGAGNLHRTSMNALERVSDTPADGIPKIKVISVSDSFMLFDWSFYGGSLTMEDDIMQKVYGMDIPPLSVLHGKVETPADLKEACARIAVDFKALSEM
ncbi:hypothetical protein HYH02_010845 [Chlamydomonas schloesseri]|uniref:Ysc84 actin-binding domain-containing protein n=1 Tax=Chlamydomonas schloesseri TaxID=2026947 RepID=A0A835TGP3_9CHLO|nr:hypothetical protein HYH02_010845 [Chlamydomonas schloesseri]|eukprot:KAG2438390.1 hypothetical protein HYH02_010845 [Chlamydomonas schloesseri]